MTDNVQKTPLVGSLNAFARNVTGSMQELISKSVPASLVSVDASGTIATIQFEIDSVYTIPQVTCPIGFPEFIRFPVTKGTLGYVVPADYYMGGMSGLGGGRAQLTRMANLANCVWMPVGNKGNDPTLNPNAVVLYGPDGCIITNKDSVTSGGASQSLINGVEIKVDKDGNVIIYGAHSVSSDVQGFGQRTTYIGGDTWRVDVYDQGATVITNHLPVHPPQIPPP